MKKNIIVSIIALAFICTFSSCKVDNADENYTHRGFMMFRTWEENFNYFFPKIELACNFNTWRNAPAEEKDEIQKKYFSNYSIRDLGHEYGTVTKRPRRCGWLDLVTLKYAIDINGVNYKRTPDEDGLYKLNINFLHFLEQ